MQKKIALLAALLFIFCPASSYATMPLVTDDTGTLGKEKIQVEIGYENSRVTYQSAGKLYKLTDNTATATASYGVLDNIDLIASIPFKWYDYRKNEVVYDEQSAISDIALQLKWRFFQTKKKGLSLALKPGIILPTGNENDNLGNGKMSGEVTLIATHTNGWFTSHINLGYTRNEYSLESVRDTSNSNIWRASFATELHRIHYFRFVGDVGMETPKDKDAPGNETYILAGTIVEIDRDTEASLGVRKKLNKSDNSTETNMTLIGGITMHF